MPLFGKKKKTGEGKGNWGMAVAMGRLGRSTMSLSTEGWTTMFIYICSSKIVLLSQFWVLSYLVRSKLLGL